MRKILCYDLHGADSEDYQDFYDYLEENFDATRATESVFVFFSDQSNETLRDVFVKHLGKDVSLLVADLPRGVYRHNIENCERWLNK